MNSTVDLHDVLFESLHLKFETLLQTNNEEMVSFQNLFKDCPDYGIPPFYFDVNSNRVHCSTATVTKSLRVGVRNGTHPKMYENTFSMANWTALPAQEQQKHTLACCQECCNEHQVLQQWDTSKPGPWTLDWTVDWTMDWTPPETSVATRIRDDCPSRAQVGRGLDQWHGMIVPHECQWGLDQ